MRTHAQAVVCLAGAALLWSLGGLLIKSIQWHPLAIVATRSAIAAATLFALLPRPHLTCSPVQWGAALCYLGTVALFVTATKLTTAPSATLLTQALRGYHAIILLQNHASTRKATRLSLRHALHSEHLAVRGLAGIAP